MNFIRQGKWVTSLLLSLVGLMNWAVLIVNSSPAGTLEIASPAGETSRVQVSRSLFSKTDPAGKARAGAAFVNLPLSFVANQGQTDPCVKFVAESDGYRLFLTPSKAVLNIIPSSASASAVGTVCLSIKVVGANRTARLEGLDSLPGRSNYLVGNDPNRWQTNIPTFARIRQKNVYRGIDLVYYGKGRELEYDFKVAPGANPEAIRLEFQGAEKMRLDANGDLLLTTSAGEVRHHIPLVYQEVNGVRQPIASRIEIKGRHRVGFKVGSYDRRKPLVVDPVLSYSIYYANGESSAQGMAIDAQGNVYLTGRARTASFQSTTVTAQVGQAQYAGFVTKLNSAGTDVVYSTLIGGQSGDSIASRIVIDADGNVYVAGSTKAADYPTTAGAFQTTPRSAGKGECFVTKLNPAGSAFVYSTLLGGSSGNDNVGGLAIDSSRNVYVVGSTSSADFPVTPGAFQRTFIGGGSGPLPYADVFVAKLNASGSALIYSTYLGGSKGDTSGDITVDAAGNTYVTGTTFSPDFPTTPGAIQTDKVPNTLPTGTAFVSKINATGSQLLYSTYLGNESGGGGITVDAGGNAYVTGRASSEKFPTLNASQSSPRQGTPIKSTDGGKSWTDSSGGLLRRGFTPGPVAFDPKNPSRIYVGNGQGEVYRSTNGGSTWTAINRGLPVAYPVSIVVDPSTPTTVYLTMGDPGGSLFKSTDGGDTWTRINASISPFDLIIDPVIPTTLYASSNPNGNGSRFMKSTDGGLTWKESNRGIPDASYVEAKAVNPLDHSILFAATLEKVYKSVDNGNTWAAVVEIAGSNNRVVFDPQNPSTVYVVSAAGDYDSASGDGRGNPRKRSALASIFEGVIKSTDSGATWTAINTGLPKLLVPYSLVIQPTTSSVYLSAATGLYKTTDGGQSWTTVYAFLNSWTIILSPDGNTFFASGLPYGTGDAFVSKLNPDGTSLIYSTLLGGVGEDFGMAITVDASGSAYVTGGTLSRDFPITNGFAQSSPVVSPDVFIAKLTPDGRALDFSATLGGSLSDVGERISVDGAGNIYVAGTTRSTDFPATNSVQSGSPGAANTGGSFLLKVSLTDNPTRIAPRITGVSIQGKKLFVYGEQFSAGATILIDGREQNTFNDPQNQATALISKKAGNKIGEGQHVMIQVRNADGSLSNEYSFARPAQ